MAWFLGIGIPAAVILGLSLLATWWFTPQPKMRCNTNGVIISRKTRYNGSPESCLTKYEAKCPSCGWVLKLDGYDLTSAFVSEYGERARVEQHHCPTIEELIKPKTWELL